MKLYQHQQRVLDDTRDQNRVAYYLDMGLGKTFVGSEKMKELGAHVNLVVCQKSKVQDWLDHFCQNYGESEFEFVIDGRMPASLEFFIKNPDDYKSAVCVINYDLIFRRPELSKLRDFTLMLDESSIIQNETSKRSKFILKKLFPENVILLSGTPTGGKYERLWSQCQLIGWKISKDAFWQTYVDFHYENDEGYPLLVIDGYKNIERLKRKLREHGAVFMKSEEVFDLPKQIDNKLRVDTTKEYRKFVKSSIVMVDDIELVGDTSLTKMLYERMLCGQYNADKLNAFRDLVESTDDRLIVFYNFTEELNRLIQIASESRSGNFYSVVNGETKDLTSYESRDDSVTFVQYQAGSMGLNLQKANKIVYFTPPLSSELFEQSKKRIHRIGQERTCFYYYMVCRGSIEEHIYKTLAMRRDYTNHLFVNK